MSRNLLSILCFLFSVISFNNIYSQSNDHDYFPLHIGNSYQFYVEGFYQGGTSYSLVYRSVTRDSLIHGMKYFNYDNQFLRYSKEDQKVYKMEYDTDRVYMDFNIPPSGTFMKFIWSIFGSHYVTAEVSSGTIDLFNKTRNWNGYDYSYDYVNETYENVEKFADSIGIYYVERAHVGAGSYWGTYKIISAILYDSLNVPHAYPCGFIPQITVIPKTEITSNYLYLTFQVGHPNQIAPYGVSQGINYISSVKLEFFYQKGDSLLNISSSDCYESTIGNYFTDNYFHLDLLKRGFDIKYRIKAIDRCYGHDSSYSPASGYYTCKYVPTGISDKETSNPDYQLFQNYPNPFNPLTIINYTLQKSGKASIKIFNIEGEEIRNLIDETKSPGEYSVTFDGKDNNGKKLPSGVYYYSLFTNDNLETKKMLLLK